MDYFPLFVKLSGRRCLIVGAGETALRKINLLLKTQLAISVVAPEIHDSINQLADRRLLTVHKKPFEADDLDTHHIVISATQCPEVNAFVAAQARLRGIPINVVDNPQLCDFIFPALVDRSPVVIAVSTGGASPVLARLLRAKLEASISPAYGQLAQLAAKFRTTVSKTLKTPAQRRAFWEHVFQGPVAELVFSGRQSEAESGLQALLETSAAAETKGEVYLIGAGPGAADLLTFRALRLMQQGDVVLYDNLVSAEILELTRRDAEKIYVGKRRSHHSVPQESINEMLARLALAGKRVVRLKGGDPFIFGRGGEEIETLMQHGVSFQVIPGITAASGCACYAGIPLTHRDHAQSCIFVTGHSKDGSINLNWEHLARPNQTIVIYMGLMGLPHICKTLIDFGCPQDHPIAVIQQGTTQRQKVIKGTLTSMPDQLTKEPIDPPTLIIIGTVVNLHQRLHWYTHS